MPSLVLAPTQEEHFKFPSTLRSPATICCGCSVAQSCLTLCDPMDCPPGSSVHEIFQARILEWVALSSISQNLLKFMSPIPASNPRKQFASDSHSQSAYIRLNQRALSMFSSLPLCFHISLYFLLVLYVWSKKTYLIVN